MTHREKYRELVGLLEESGVLQHDEEWALRVQKMIKDHKKSVGHDHQPND